MVYMSGSRMARNAASICNRNNVCGGVKKPGLAPSVGWYLSSNPNLIRAKNTSFNDLCNSAFISRTIGTQKYGYHAVHGGYMG
jgi:hypothetical protein